MHIFIKDEQFKRFLWLNLLKTLIRQNFIKFYNNNISLISLFYPFSFTWLT